MYVVMIVGDYSRVTWPYFSETSDVLPVFGSSDIRAQDHPCAMECLRSDNSTEFVKQEFMALLKHHGLRSEYTSVDSPKHSSVAERCIAMMLELAMASYLEAPRMFGGVPLPPTEPL